MGSWLSAETNTILLTALIGLIVTGAGTVGAWLRAQTKKFNDLAQINNEMLTKNTELAQDIKRQTDGLTKKMTQIAAAAAFTKGRVQGREEGESSDPYEDLYKLESEIGTILEINLDKKKPKA